MGAAKTATEINSQLFFFFFKQAFQSVPSNKWDLLVKEKKRSLVSLTFNPTFEWTGFSEMAANGFQ